MLGLRPACGYQEVALEYNKSLKLIHPDQCFLDGAAEAFMKLQPAYTEWNTARARQGWSQPAAPSSALVNSDSGLQRPLDLLPSRSLMGPRKVPLLHLTTTFLVTVSLRRKITPFTIGMRVCNSLVTRRFPGSSLNFAMSLLLRRCLWERIVQNSRVA